MPVAERWSNMTIHAAERQDDKKIMISNLPVYLNERTRSLGQRSLDGGFVLYWMRTAVRIDENPALDVARLIAHEHNLPLLVYQGLSEHYEYASDRHHTFMLQGARDVQNRFQEIDISYVFHLATSDDRRPHLITLAESAAMVVTEEIPVDPPRRFLKSLDKKTTTPIVCVDTACVVPVQLIRKPYALRVSVSQRDERTVRRTTNSPLARIASKNEDL